MSSAPVLSDAAKRALQETPLTRFYVRLGLGLGAAIVVASMLVWTGAFERMLTFGNWGTLTQRDLLGFLVAMFWMMTAAILVVLFTLKRTLMRVEVDVQARDVELDDRVRRMEAHIRTEFQDARDDLRAGHDELMALADRSHQHDREILARARAEVAKRVQAARAELASEIGALREAANQRAEVEDHERMQAVLANLRYRHEENGLERRIAKAEGHQAKLVGLMRAETAALRDLRDTVEHKVAELARQQADNVARDIAQRRRMELLAIDHKGAVDALRERLQLEHEDTLRTIDDRMHGLVHAGVNERIRAAIAVAFRPGRFYKVLAGVLGSGIVLVALLALLGAEGPGMFPARVAIFALGLASAMLAGIVFVLIWSFTDTVRTLRGFAGAHPDHEPNSV